MTLFKYRNAGLVIGLLMLCSPASAQEALVLFVPLQPAGGVSETDAANWNDVVRLEILENVMGRIALIETPSKKCDEACIFELAKQKTASHVLRIQLKRTGKKWIVIAKLFSPDSEALLFMKRIECEQKQAVEDAITSVTQQARATIIGDENHYKSSDTVSESPAPQVENDLFYGDLIVTVKGMRKGDMASVNATAEVYINKTLVGKTPYSDGLPRGQYEITIVAYGKKYRREIYVEPGETYQITAVVEVPLSAEAKADINQKYTKQSKDALKKEAENWLRQREAWETSVAQTKQKRKKPAIAGAILLPAGTAMTVAGIILLSKAKKYKDDYDVIYLDYESSTHPDYLEKLENELQALDQERKLRSGFGSVLLSLGVTSMVTGLVFLGRMSKYRYADKPIPSDEVKNHLQLSLQPIVGQELAGIRLKGIF